MPDINTNLPKQVELGATRDIDWQTDIVATDGGHEVRNGRWSTPLRTFDVSYPACVRTDPNYLAIRALYDQARGSLLTFGFHDWTSSGEVVTVRFDSPLKITGIDRLHDHIESFTLKEVRE